MAELEAKIEELSHVAVNDEHMDLNKEIAILRGKSLQCTRGIYASLSPWQIVQVARHPSRPHLLDYLERIIVDFEELHGDRYIGDDPAMICGIGRCGEYPVAIIGQQKGDSTEERLKRNYGMVKPEGYRKALRVMKLAERHGLPVLSFIDTPGAYPGIDAEERGQSGAIADNLMTMSELRTPIIATVIGEGGSGGALAIGVADKLFMLQYSTYSVISPEGCASILWKDTSKADEAAEAMGITAQYLYELGLIDMIVDEPVGGAHRDHDAAAENLRKTLLDSLSTLLKEDIATLVHTRQQKFRTTGVFKQN